MKNVKQLVQTLVRLLEHEPVAVWGIVATAVLNAVALPLGLSVGEVEGIASGLTLLGIPVIRSQVSPVAALKVLVQGAQSEVNSGVPSAPAAAADAGTSAVPPPASPPPATPTS